MVPAYGRLLQDVFDRNAALSIGGDEAEQSWRIVDPVLAAWAADRVPPEEHPADSAGPSARWAAQVGGSDGDARRGNEVTWAPKTAPPTAFSSAAICWLTDDRVSPSRPAARPNLPSSARAAMVLRWRSSASAMTPEHKR
jgi:glucose-6-phosphate dehydrogenase-like protein